MTYGLREDTIKKINSVFVNYTNISKVLLYGSRAKGNYKNGSDIDLCVISKDMDIKELQKISLDLDDLLLPYKIDLSVYEKITNKELKEHIDRIGVVFFELEKKTF